MSKEIIYRKLEDLKKLPNNPRTITKEDMLRLQKSIQDNADYFEARPLILSNRTGELVILAGNQRYEAAKALGLETVPTFLLEGLTEEREREIIIRDNVSNGEWDMDILANEWDTEDLAEWGVDLPILAPSDLETEVDFDSAYTSDRDVNFFEFEKALDIDERTAERRAFVENCQNAELKKLLEKRLNDFVTYDFAYIADYYLSGATAEEKKALEALGLVIISPRKAFDEGILSLTETLKLGGA